MDHNTQSIGDVIKKFLRERGLEERIEEVDINERWEEIAGPLIAKHTKSLQIKNKVMTLKVNSAALRHTLSFSRSEFIEKINTAVGKEIVKELILK